MLPTATHAAAGSRRAQASLCSGLNPWRALFLVAVACCAMALWHFAPRRLSGVGGDGGEKGYVAIGKVAASKLPLPPPPPLPSPSLSDAATDGEAAEPTADEPSSPPSPSPAVAGPASNGDPVEAAEMPPLIAIPADFYGPTPSPRPARRKEDAPPQPTRDPAWVAEQRPRTDDGGAEHAVTSHLLEESPAHSMNPPPIAPHAWPGVDAAARAELGRRLVVGIAMGVHSGRADVDGAGVGALRIINTLVTSLLPVLQTNYVYRCVPPPRRRQPRRTHCRRACRASAAITVTVAVAGCGR